MLLGEIKQAVTKLKGIGPGTAGQLAGLGILSVRDLLVHLPREYEDRQTMVPLSAWTTGPVHTVIEVIAHDFIGYGRRQTLKIYVQDESTTAALVCFNRNFLQNVLKVGERFHLFGRFEYKYGELQSASFETAPYPDQHGKFGRLLPVYPLTGSLNQGILRRSIREALEGYARYIDDELPLSLRNHYGFPSKRDALYQLHFPANFDEQKKARKALAFEELLYFQILVARRTAARKSTRRKPEVLPLATQQQCIQNLPFSLTPDQKTVLREIREDLNSSRPMGRLLQGDVGVGKTLVAFLSILPVAEAGHQSAFLAPTELLALQHAEKAAEILEPLGLRVAFLSGKVDRKARQPLLDALNTGEIDLIIGTHALLTEEVSFRDLRLVIIDEQHKFGVEQRGRLVEKGNTPDLLLMTATPIPRTLTLTFFGDFDVSSIRSAPKGRKPVITHLAREGNEMKVYAAVRKEIERGRQAYFIYPRIEKSDKSNLKDTEGMAEYLQKEVFPDFKVALIHSRVREEVKIQRMKDFSAGRIQVLVSTSVVEVGVDVANATCMVIEHAERFGLAGLHQLRGRVGRSDMQSYAFLVYSEELSDEGKKRLLVMKRTSDGFEISEEDLKIRGPGEMTGTRQSGFMRLTFADIGSDLAMLDAARKDAFRIVEADPGLLEPSHKTLRKVLETCPPFPDDILAGG